MGGNYKGVGDEASILDEKFMVSVTNKIIVRNWSRFRI